MSIDDADMRHRIWMRELLETALDRGDLSAAGEPTFGWNDRSVGVRARRRGGGDVWLRLVRESPAWAGDASWTGNADADAVEDVPKPRVLNAREWNTEHEGEAYRVRAEVMTLLDGRPCSPTPVLHDPLELPEAWWEHLEATVARVSETPTGRIRVAQADVARRLLVFFGDRIEPQISAWRTAHGDLHWANLLAPDLAVVDWEGWGVAPAGFDAAVLLCHSLLVSEIATEVRGRFSGVLDTTDGLKCQLYVVAWMLHRIEHGDDPAIAGPLHRHAETVQARLEG